MIVVSNRGPVTYDRDETASASSGAAAAGSSPRCAGSSTAHDVTWIASATTDEDRDRRSRAAVSDRDVVAPGARAGRVRAVLQRDREPAALVHPALAVGPRDAPGSRRACTRRGTTATSPSTGRSQTRLLPNWTTARTPPSSSTTTTCISPRASSRQARPDALLAQFVHIPWPADWSVLPRSWRQAVHDGLLANDVVGFPHAALGGQLPRGRRRRHRTRVTHHPISVDVGEFDGLSESTPVLAREAELVATRPEKLIVRVDRTDPSKNIVRGFRAFRLLLEEHPEWHGRVTMLALLDPSRQTIPEYAEYLAAIEREAGDDQRALRPCRLAARRPARRGRLPSRRSPRTSSSTCCS